MYSTAAASGGATQGPTISADRAPIAATPASEPPRWRSLNRPSFDRSAAGSCSSYRPNDDSASATNSRSEEHTSELQSLMRSSYAVFSLNKTKHNSTTRTTNNSRAHHM